MRLLITGGAGFIGGSLIRELLKNKEYKIYNIDKISYASDTRGIDDTITNLINHAEYHLLKINLEDKQAVDEAINISNPDIIIHLAAESHVDRSIQGPSKFIQSNIIGTFNLLESARKHWINLDKKRKNIFRFLHISTDEVFGSLDKDGFFSEESPYKPTSPYSASKAASDHLVKSWHHTFGLPVLITNCSNNFGPWQFPEKLIPLTILKAFKQQEIPVYGNGLNVRDWLYVKDHIKALILVLKKGAIGETYCIGGFGERTNIEVVEKICEIMNRKKPLSSSYKDLITFVKDRPGHDKRYSINSDKIRNNLGWFPELDFEYALEQTVDWYLSNLEWCDSICLKSGYTGERLGILE